MKILLVTDLYPIGKENITKALYDFVMEWHRQGHEVEVIRPNFKFNTKIRGRKIIKEKIYNENGIKIYNLNFTTPFLFNVRRMLPKNFSLNNYDVMLSHMPSGALMAQKLLEKEKIKYVCAVHASDITVLKNFKYALYFKQKLKQAYLTSDKIAARSPVLQQKIEQIIPEVQDKTFVAYSGINKNFITDKKERSFNYENLQICTASSLIKRKNIDIIIESLSKLNEKFKYTIIGSGKYLRNLKKLSAKLGIKSKILFLGHLEHNEVMKKLKEHDIFILLSDNETFGLVYLEAMAAGNIVIAKKNDGIDGIIQDGKNGFLINADNAELVKCIQKIYNLKETEINKIRANAVETVQKMTIEAAAKSYLDNLKIKRYLIY